MASSEVLPLRPLTLAELLDAAVALLRRHARALLGTALLLCIGEQLALSGLRHAAGAEAPWYFLAHTDRLGQYWLMFGTGLATETTIIAVLAGLAARAAQAALDGTELRGRALISPRGGRFGRITATAVVVGVLGGVAALAGLVPWLFAYGLLGLAVPAVVVERASPVRALGRSLVLSSRIRMRALGVRLVGYLGWLAIRVALGLGGIAALELVLPASRQWSVALSIATWVAVDAVAYATLACLDAVLYFETRMRTEGLDIAIALHRDRLATMARAAPR